MAGYKWKSSDAPVDGYLRGDPEESLFQSHSLHTIRHVPQMPVVRAPNR